MSYFRGKKQQLQATSVQQSRLKSRRLHVKPFYFVCFLLVYIFIFVIPSLISRLTPSSTPASIMSEDDYILTRDYDASPVVVEKYKLIFFTTPKVGCTVWKQLFRRIAGFPDWQDVEKAHDPDINGLKYLVDYYREYGTQKVWNMLASPEWTKVLFVRDPKERFLSAYLDKAVSNLGQHMHKCCNERLNRNDYDRSHRAVFSDAKAPTSPLSKLNTTQGCVDFAMANLDNFFTLVSTTCPEDGHWLPQSQRIDAKYWSLFHDGNWLFVGHMDSMEADAKRLLQKVGAWDEYGANGWGKDGTLPMFGRATVNAVTHATGAKRQLAWYYNPANERMIDEFYARDYQNKMLSLPKLPIVYENAR